MLYFRDDETQVPNRLSSTLYLWSNCTTSVFYNNYFFWKDNMLKCFNGYLAIPLALTVNLHSSLLQDSKDFQHGIMNLSSLSSLNGL